MKFAYRLKQTGENETAEVKISNCLWPIWDNANDIIMTSSAIFSDLSNLPHQQHFTTVYYEMNL